MARGLLLGWVVFLAAPSCVLPPPPVPEPTVDVPLAIDLQLLEPVGAGPIILERAFGDAGRTFSVDHAVVGGNKTAAVSWFVGFKPETPQPADFRGTEIILSGCHPLLIGKAPGESVVIEALVTQGELIIDPDQSDPRVTAEGEPILRAVWTVKVVGEASLCLPPQD